MNQAFLFIERARSQALGNTDGGSYRIRLRRNVTIHVSFSDLPVLEPGNDAERETRTRVLRLVTDYTRSSSFSTNPHEGELVDSIKKFPPAMRPGVLR
jgi:hypothetical protein